MSTITPTFALSIVPRYFYLSVPQSAPLPDIRFSWAFSKNEYEVSIDRVSASFKTEEEAWQYAVGNCPDVLRILQSGDSAYYRACGLRGEMMLTLGTSRLTAMKDSMHTEIVGIFERSLHALGAIKLSKAVAKVTRVASVKGVSWLEVRARVRVPFHSEPVLLGVRCFPSPIEEKTWSVRLRMPASTDTVIYETQMRFEELVRDLGYQGITVKDVQNGSCFDL
jgi:hypothetical protein